MQQHDPSRMKKPAYKEPWFWAVFAPLIVIFFVCAVLLKFAIVGGDDRVVGDYYKQGRMINNRFAMEAVASRLALSASVEFNAKLGLVRLSLQGNRKFDEPAMVLLTVSHPLESEQDYALPLQKVDAGQYQAPWKGGDEDKRYLILTGNLVGQSDIGEASSWRLSSEVDFGRSHFADFKAGTAQ